MKKFAHVSSQEATVPFTIEGTPLFVDAVVNNSFWNTYVIGDVGECGEPREYNPSVSIVESSVLNYDIETRTIECDQDHAVPGIKFVGHFLEQERQKKGIYTVHGNVISLGSRAIACIGGISGIGKTSLSSAAHDNGWEWTSDEKFLMNESGQYVQALASIQDDTKSALAARDARPLSPSSLRDIVGFVVPIIADQPLVVHAYDTPKAEYHLYEELGRNITAGRATLRDYNVPLPSLDTRGISARRLKCARELALRVPMYFMIGEALAILDRCEVIIDHATER